MLFHGEKNIPLLLRPLAQITRLHDDVYTCNSYQDEAYGDRRVPGRVSHVAIGESSKELAKPNLWILAILAKSINISFS